MTRSTLLALAGALALSSCATADMEGPARPEKHYRTGSNIPQREGSLPDGVGTSTPGTGDTRLGTPGMPMPLPGGR